MQTNRTSRLDQRLPFFWWLVFLVAALALAPLLSRGTAGGDEGDVLQFLAAYRTGGWAALTSIQNSSDFLAHRLFWLGEKSLWDQLVRLILPSELLARPSIYASVMVLDGTFFMIAAFGLSIWHLQKRWGFAIALLASSALFIASSGIGLFAGGFSECLMCLLVIIMATQLDRAGPLPLWRFALVILAGLGLVAAKVYAAPFVLALALLLPAARNQKILYGVIFTVAPILWLVIQSGVRAGEPSGMLGFYANYMGGRDLTGLLSDGLAFFFSLSFGILPCFPLVLLAAYCGKAHHFALAVKVAATLGVAAILLSFPFWAGPGGLGGPRYIVPFLLVFVPEIAAGLRRIADNPHWQALLLLVPAAAALFLPCLEFRNSLVTRYANDPRPLTSIFWSHTEPGMHPAIMGWSVVRATAEHRASLTFSSDMRLSAPVQDIFPMTALSRMIYVLERGKQAPDRIRTAAEMLEQYKLDKIWFWQVLRLLLATLLLGGLTVAAWPRYRSQ